MARRTRIGPGPRPPAVSCEPSTRSGKPLPHGTLRSDGFIRFVEGVVDFRTNGRGPGPIHGIRAAPAAGARVRAVPDTRNRRSGSPRRRRESRMPAVAASDGAPMPGRDTLAPREESTGARKAASWQAATARPRSGRPVDGPAPPRVPSLIRTWPGRRPPRRTGSPVRRARAWWRRSSRRRERPRSCAPPAPAPARGGARPRTRRARSRRTPP